MFGLLVAAYHRDHAAFKRQVACMRSVFESSYALALIDTSDSKFLKITVKQHFSNFLISHGLPVWF